MPSIRELKAFNFQNWIEREQREAEASGRQRAGLGRWRAHGDGGGRAQSDGATITTTDRGILLSAEGRHLSSADGDSGQASDRSSD